MASLTETLLDVKNCVACNQSKSINKFSKKTTGKGLRIKCSSCYYFKRTYTIRCKNARCYNQITNISRCTFCHNCIETGINLDLKMKRQKTRANADLQYYIKTSCTCKYKKEITRYHFFNDPIDNGKDAIFGIDVVARHVLEGDREFEPGN